MSNEPLLLPSAKSGVVLQQHPVSPWWRIGAIAIGIVMVAVGAADMLSRLGEGALGGSITMLAFAPAVLSTDPSLLEAVTGSSASTTVSADPIIPVRLLVPAIGVSAPVESVGKKADGAMATPANFTDVSWYSPGSKPGGSGNAVFAGHVNNARGTDGVFADLSDVELGDSIIVEGAGGERLQYAVTDRVTYPADEAPKEEIFQASGPSQVVLITCDGEWDSLAHSYDKRLVVVARLVSL